MSKCGGCKRNFCYVCVAKDFVECTSFACERKVCSDCSVNCDGCDELHCHRCASEFIEGLCFDCVEENPDWSGEDSEDEW